MILGVSGHRPHRAMRGFPVQDYAKSGKALLEMAKLKLVELSPAHVNIGMAQGWDTACASACAMFHIPYTAYLPCPNHGHNLPADAQKLHAFLLKAAAKVVVVCPEYTAKCIFDRNEVLVDNSNQMLVLWDGHTHGGTADAVRHARGWLLPIINVWDEWKAYDIGKTNT